MTLRGTVISLCDRRKRTQLNLARIGAGHLRQCAQDAEVLEHLALANALRLQAQAIFDLCNDVERGKA